MITQDEAETLVLIANGDVTKLPGFEPLNPGHYNCVSGSDKIMVNKALGIVAKRPYISPCRLNPVPPFAIETIIVPWILEGENKYSWFSNILFQPLADFGEEEYRIEWSKELDEKFHDELAGFDVHFDNVAWYNGAPCAIDW